MPCSAIFLNGGDNIAQWLTFLISDPDVLGLIPAIPAQLGLFMVMKPI